MDLRAIANKTIPLPDNRSSFYKDGETADIMHEVLECYKASGHQLAKFAPALKAGTLYETCSVIWHFVKSNIHYKVDPPGLQWVKTPARVWADKQCDCKSYSLFIAACLQGLGIKGAFRFVSFSKTDPQPTHVYVVVSNGGREIILDCVVGGFDVEKPYTYKYDYNMSNIYRLSGITGTPGMNLPVSYDGIDLGKLEAAIIKERLQLEKAVLQKSGKHVSGIGQVMDAHDYYISQMDSILSASGKTPRLMGIGGVVEDYLAQIPDTKSLTAEDRRDLMWSLLQQTGIDKNRSHNVSVLTNKFFPAHDPKNTDLSTWMGFYYPEVNRAKGLDAKFKILNPMLKAHGIDYVLKREHPTFWQGVAKVAKGVAKVVTAPVRLVAKGILEISLPNAAPNFLYLFINDPKLITRLPEAVRKKRDRAMKKADFVCNTIGMGREHFMGIVRNGIMKKVGKSPEDYIAEQLKLMGISGIGVLPFAAIAGAGKFLVALFKKLLTLFGKKDAAGEEDIAPDSSDWNISANEAGQIAQAVKDQPNNRTFLEKVASVVERGSEVVSTVDNTIKTIKQQTDTGDQTWHEEGGITYDKDGGTLDPVVVTSGKSDSQATQPAPAKDNTMLYVGLGVAALFLLKKK